MKTICGFCSGRGWVHGRRYDREGRAQVPPRMTCEYCGGEGACEDGDRLVAAPEPRLTVEWAADLARAGLPAWA